MKIRVPLSRGEIRRRRIGVCQGIKIRIVVYSILLSLKFSQNFLCVGSFFKYNIQNTFLAPLERGTYKTISK